MYDLWVDVLVRTHFFHNVVSNLTYRRLTMWTRVQVYEVGYETHVSFFAMFLGTVPECWLGGEN